VKEVQDATGQPVHLPHDDGVEALRRVQGRPPARPVLRGASDFRLFVITPDLRRRRARDTQVPPYHQQYLAKNPGGYCNHGFCQVAC
jgi:hypothetical protein